MNERLKQSDTDSETGQPAADKARHDRRAALKSTMLGGAAVTGAAWVTPVINTVILPAHAQTTDSGGEPGGGTDPILGPYFGDVSELLLTVNEDPASSANSTDSLLAKAINTIVPNAHAGSDSNLLCVEMTSDTTYNATLAYPYNLSMDDGWVVEQNEIKLLQIGSGYAYFRASGTIGTPSFLEPDCPNFKGYPLNVTMPTVNDVTITIFMASTTIPATACRLPEASCPTLYNPCVEQVEPKQDVVTDICTI
ncbi:MAG: hypothetical protein AAF402_04555 [Pseudomonadota bacterium]